MVTLTLVHDIQTHTHATRGIAVSCRRPISIAVCVGENVIIILSLVCVSLFLIFDMLIQYRIECIVFSENGVVLCVSIRIVRYAIWILK